ncbi:hypothetical protein [Mycolicibacterium arenosum]|uniref:PASTA domain-containing protein n=1 Tax=Mycolicibacterium arenosum TaxID=2952157 RepID=A0ABT1M7N9_9MYCO|nr:hypothetical protein [Mycolicibacterium sp. CAU 1645]MCP9275199.1 hypothetical protein [Mycolicibacterium sp. CAU 1645]
MKKLVALGAAALAIPAAVGATALFTTPAAMSEPASVAGLNVIGEPYGRAMAILKSQGVKGSFGGSVGSELPQAQCIVDSQKVVPPGKIVLMLNCTRAAAADAAGQMPGGSPQGPNVGSNGVTTVQATPVGPQPGMSPPG